jgi:hypothetical protein
VWRVNEPATEAEESPLLRFFTRKRIVKTLQRNSHCEELYQVKTRGSRMRGLEWGVICSAEIRNTVIITQVCKNIFFSAAWNIFGKLYVF